MNDLKPRTKRFALDVILYSRKLPRGDEFTIIKRQLIRSATSVAANYRAAQRAKSKAPKAPALTSSTWQNKS
jgi:four helix bundle protein